MATVFLHGKAMLSGGLFQEPPIASPETGPKNSDNKPAVGGRCSKPCVPGAWGFHALVSPRHLKGTRHVDHQQHFAHRH
ncbi:hypothetical protein METHPM2_1580008 [Pseudomonas sp. PM2]